MKLFGLVVVMFVVTVTGCASDSTSGDDVGPGPGPGPGPGSSCSASADNCTGETICIASRCEAAFPRTYRVTNVRVTATDHDTSGATWDAGGGLPDLFVEVASNGTVLATSATVDNVASATFAGPFEVMLSAGDEFNVTSYDEDIAANDMIDLCGFNPFPAAVLRLRNVNCTTLPAGHILAYRIEPK